MMKKRISKAFLGFGVASLAVAGALWTSASIGGGDTTARIDSLKAERSTLRKELADARLKIQGYQKSLADIPDSTRMAQSGLLVKRYKTMTKQEVILGHQEAEQTRLIRKLQRQRARAAKERKRQATAPGIAGALLLAGGLVLRRRTGAGRVSP